MFAARQAPLLLFQDAASPPYASASTRKLSPSISVWLVDHLPDDRDVMSTNRTLDDRIVGARRIVMAADTRSATRSKSSLPLSQSVCLPSGSVWSSAAGQRVGCAVL